MLLFCNFFSVEGHVTILWWSFKVGLKWKLAKNIFCLKAVHLLILENKPSQVWPCHVYCSCLSSNAINRCHSKKLLIPKILYGVKFIRLNSTKEKPTLKGSLSFGKFHTRFTRNLILIKIQNPYMHHSFWNLLYNIYDFRCGFQWVNVEKSQHL